MVRIIKSRSMRWTEHVARIGKKMNEYMLFVGKPERKRPPGRPRHKWMDSTKLDLVELDCGGVDWIDMAKDKGRRRALVKAIMKLLAP
jgi:hypothetical protein